MCEQQHFRPDFSQRNMSCLEAGQLVCHPWLLVLGVLNVKNKSHAFTADVTIPDGETNDVIVA